MALAVFAALAGIGAGCGGDPTEAERVTGAIVDLQDDLAAGRLAEVCDGMARRPRVEIGSVGHRRRPTTCTADLRAFLRADGEAAAAYEDRVALSDARRPRVDDVAVAGDGSSAKATLTLGGSPFVVPLVKEDGRWKLADFFGSTGPPPRALR